MKRGEADILPRVSVPVIHVPLVTADLHREAFTNDAVLRIFGDVKARLHPNSLDCVLHRTSSKIARSVLYCEEANLEGLDLIVIHSDVELLAQG